jgi:hypothetical protein
VGVEIWGRAKERKILGGSARELEGEGETPLGMAHGRPPLDWSKFSSSRRPMSMHACRGGLSSKRTLARALNHGQTWAPLSPTSRLVKVPPREGTAFERCVTNDRHLERLKCPDSYGGHLGETGGCSAPSDLPWLSGNLGGPGLSWACGRDCECQNRGCQILIHGRARTRGVCEAVIAVPAPAEDTASIELAGAADGTATAKPEALGSCAGGEARLERDRKARKGVGAARCHETTWHGASPLSKSNQATS